MKSIVAGVDEVGRGSLVGPVYAAAVILKKKLDKKKLKDSKQLTKKNREILEKYVKKKFLLVYSISNIKKNRKIKYFERKFACDEKSHKKIKKKTCAGIN